VDAAIHDANNQMLRDYDDLLLKTAGSRRAHECSWTSGHQTETTAQQMNQALGQTMDRLNDEFAKLIVTGKGSFSQIFETSTRC